MNTRGFFERSIQSLLLPGADGPVVRLHDEAGWSQSSGAGQWSWSVLKASSALAGEVPGDLDALPQAARALVEDALSRSFDHHAVALSDLAAELGACLPGVRIECSIKLSRRFTVCVSDDTCLADQVENALLEFRVFAARGAEQRSVLREHAFADLGCLRAALPSLREAAAVAASDAAARLNDVACPRGERRVLFPPGADAGVFFHEVCGHALEGDVVLRGASLLARCIGDRVAREFLTVVDDPCRGAGTVNFRFDDEGQPARAAVLVHQGVIHEPILDARTAAALRLPPNGHGRRAGFRHPAIPRMAHTAVQPHEGDFQSLLAEIDDGLLVTHLSPRFVSLSGGGFSFFVDEAREIRGGRLGQWVRPALLRSDALAALNAIDRVGADTRPFFGIKGCGKLDQGGLPVSFEHPTLRFDALHIEPE